MFLGVLKTVAASLDKNNSFVCDCFQGKQLLRSQNMSAYRDEEQANTFFCRRQSVSDFSQFVETKKKVDKEYRNFVC